uniref:Probable threonine protease PRSS50 n=1 Tax=Sciurus vulgaris TaxID=55149 RepID=A0A8D2DTZ9_SCIVU
MLLMALISQFTDLFGKRLGAGLLRCWVCSFQSKTKRLFQSACSSWLSHQQWGSILGKSPSGTLSITRRLFFHQAIPHQALSFSSVCGFSYEQDPTLRDPETMTQRWPWMVSVRADGIHVCAGTLIASRWVLAVAHCLTQHVNYTVMVGSPWIDRVTPSSSNILVLQVILNRRFRPQRYWSWTGRANNIGLLKLQKRLKYNKYVRPICLPGLDYVLEDNSICTVTGWGYPKVNGVWPQFQTIQEKEVVILNSKKCDDFYHRFSGITSLVQIINSQMICVKDGGREQFCYEETGEPLVCSLEGTWYLVGMMSWGAGCKKSEAPPIFLKVSAYQTWIWDNLIGKSLALPAPSRALLLALPLPLSLLATL